MFIMFIMFLVFLYDRKKARSRMFADSDTPLLLLTSLYFFLESWTFTTFHVRKLFSICTKKHGTLWTLWTLLSYQWLTCEQPPSNYATLPTISKCYIKLSDIKRHYRQYQTLIFYRYLITKTSWLCIAAMLKCRLMK